MVGFQAITALARAPPAEVPTRQNVFECLLLFLVGVFEQGHELGSLGQDFGGQCHQAADVDVAADAGRAGTNGRGELQGAHAARALVTEPFDGVEAGRGAPLRGQPRVDQCVAVAVGKGVGQQAGEATEGLVGKGRERVGICPQGHSDGRDLNATSGEGRVVLEDGGVAAVLERYCPDDAPPEAHRCHRAHGLSPSPHVHVVDGMSSALAAGAARRRRRPSSFRRSMGLGSGSGTSVSSRSRRPSTRRMRMRFESFAPAPASTRSTVLFETPASVASSCCVMLRSSRVRARRSPSSARTTSSVFCAPIFIIPHI